MTRKMLMVLFVLGAAVVSAQSVSQGYNPAVGPVASVTEVTWETSAPASVSTSIATYGFAPAYTSAGTPEAANTASASNLHQYYLTAKEAGVFVVRGAGSIDVIATFSYVQGQTYYLSDSGALATSSDADFDSAVVYVVASLGGGRYLLNLSDPRHFAN